MGYIDITAANAAIRQAVRTFTEWLTTHGLTVGGISFSFFDLILTSLGVYLLLDCFIPWGEGEDDD